MKTLMINDLPFADEMAPTAMTAVRGGYVNKAWNSWYGDPTGRLRPS